MKLIVEQVEAKGRITESDRSKLPDGVLCRVKYPICNVGERNRNNRVYEQAVWDTALADKDLNQKLQTRSLLGHAEHPKDTSQSSTEKVSHVVNKVWDDRKGKIFCEVDVLDTPYGRICDTLLRAGCGLGVSTRAEGELEEIKEGESSFYRVVPEAYSLKTIDFTADPSTYGAYPESVERDLVGHIQTGMKEKKIDADYATVMLESMVVAEAKSLLESIKKSAKEGYEEAGKRDGTGPFKGSAQRAQTGDVGKKKLAGEKCPNEAGAPSEDAKDYKSMTDDQLIGLTTDYEAAIEAGQMTNDMWKELEKFYKELKSRSKPVESLEAAIGRHYKKISEMFPSVKTGGMELPPMMTENVPEWQKEIDADIANKGKDQKDVMVFLAELDKKYPNDKEAIHAYIEKKSKEPLKTQESIKEDFGVLNLNHMFDTIKKAVTDKLFTEEEEKGINEAKTAVDLFAKVSRIIESLRLDLAMVRAERDKALELGNLSVSELQEKYASDILALSEQLTKKEDELNGIQVRFKETVGQDKETHQKATKEAVESIANKVAVEVRKVYEDKIAKIKEHYESELNRVKAASVAEIFQKTVVDVKIKESNLKLSENALTLLRQCKTEEEVESTIDQIRFAMKESFAHSGKPTNLKVVMDDGVAGSPLHTQTKRMVEFLNK